MGEPHPGQGNVVEPVSCKGTPEAVQLVALSLIMGPQEHSAHALPFFMVACCTTSGMASNSSIIAARNRATALQLTIKNRQRPVVACADDQFAVPAAAPTVSDANDVANLDDVRLFTP